MAKISDEMRAIIPNISRAFDERADLAGHLEAMLRLHEAHHNHPVHAAARAALSRARGEQ